LSAPDVFVIINYRALPDQRPRALQELSDLVAVVRKAEPDCKGITVVHHEADPRRIMLIERWTSREAYLGPHMQTPHIQAFKLRAGEFADGPPEITFWLPACVV
jgi:quinol monooxygenase YgiN